MTRYSVHPRYIVKHFFIILNNLQQMRLNSLPKGSLLSNRLFKVSNVSPKIIQKQMKKKYLEKDIYPQN